MNKQIPISDMQKLFEYIIVEGYGYSLIAALGIRLYSLQKQQLLYFSGFFLLIFDVLLGYHQFVPTQGYKYPPTLYYFTYGLFVSYLLFYLLSFEI